MLSNRSVHFRPEKFRRIERVVDKTLGLSRTLSVNATHSICKQIRRNLFPDFRERRDINKLRLFFPGKKWISIRMHVGIPSAADLTIAHGIRNAVVSNPFIWIRASGHIHWNYRRYNLAAPIVIKCLQSLFQRTQISMISRSCIYPSFDPQYPFTGKWQTMANYNIEYMIL